MFFFLCQAIEKARKAVDGAFKSAQKHLRSAIDHVQQKKRECKEKMKLKCSNCYNLKCKQAKAGCKGFFKKLAKALSKCMLSLNIMVFFLLLIFGFAHYRIFC